MCEDVKVNATVCVCVCVCVCVTVCCFYLKPTVGSVSSESSEDDQDIANIQLPHDLISVVLRGRHGLQGGAGQQAHLSHSLSIDGVFPQCQRPKCHATHTLSTPHLSNARYMSVVPSVVIHEDGPVGHGCDLVAVVPPRHDLGILGCVLTQPVVGLAEVIKDDA